MVPPATSLLFHPKKKNGIVQQDPSPTKKPIRPLPARARPAATPSTQSNDSTMPPLPDGPYQEFKLMSSALNGWKYDVMKFDSRKPVDLTTWQTPVRLNRKDLRRNLVDGAAEALPQAVGPMLGPDGKPVIGADGRMVMVDAEGRPIRNPPPTGGPSGGGGGGGGGAPPAKKGPNKKFQKKTKQVYLVPEETRRLRKEERYPWVLEDATGGEHWVAAMEEAAKSEMYAMFMPATSDVFKFVPAHRWYKFQKKPSYSIPTLEEAETLMARIQKNKDPERWLLHNRKGQAPSAATSALFKAEAENRTSGSLFETGPSRGPGGRKLRAVDGGGDDLFGDDDEDGGRRRDLGGEGDLDELDYEEMPADDEEKIEGQEDDDDEAKELEERLKREYKTANKLRDSNVDESEDEDMEPSKTKTGDAMRKLIRNLERNEAYDSDDEKNPYASSEEEEEEEQPMIQDGPAIQPQDQKQAIAAGLVKTEPATATTALAGGTTSPPPQPDSRAGSPAAPNLGGHSMVAKRATSPKAPRPKPQTAGATGSGSRATSPLAGGGGGSRATSPAGSSRAGSPAAPGLQAKGQQQLSQNKRKAEELGVPKKKRKPAPGGADGVLDANAILAYLRSTPNPTTRMCIQHFTPYLKEAEAKAAFTKLVKEVAVLKDGFLIIRPQFESVGSP